MLELEALILEELLALEEGLALLFEDTLVDDWLLELFSLIELLLSFELRLDKLAELLVDASLDDVERLDGVGTLD
jgi:hypothetical protein